MPHAINNWVEGGLCHAFETLWGLQVSFDEPFFEGVCLRRFHILRMFCISWDECFLGSPVAVGIRWRVWNPRMRELSWFDHRTKWPD